MKKIVSFFVVLAMAGLAHAQQQESQQQQGAKPLIVQAIGYATDGSSLYSISWACRDQHDQAGQEGQQRELCESLERSATEHFNHATKLLNDAREMAGQNDKLWTQANQYVTNLKNWWARRDQRHSSEIANLAFMNQAVREVAWAETIPQGQRTDEIIQARYRNSEELMNRVNLPTREAADGQGSTVQSLRQHADSLIRTFRNGFRERQGE